MTKSALCKWKCIEVAGKGGEALDAKENGYGIEVVSCEESNAADMQPSVTRNTDNSCGFASTQQSVVHTFFRCINPFTK